MEAWLRGLLLGIPQPLRGGAELIFTAIIRVFQWTLGLGRRAVAGWWEILAGATRLAMGLGGFVADTYDILRWLILIRIPQWANWAINTTVHWAADRFRWLEGVARGLVAGLQRLVLNLLKGLADALTTFRAWTLGRLADILSTVRILVAHALGTLGRPERLAAWAIGAIWTAWWRYAWHHIDAIADVVWRARRGLALRAINEIERILGRLL